MKSSREELKASMQDALNKVKGVVTDNTDEGKKALLGSGMARQAADAITKRKKDLDSVMGE